jgi:hypothetical protein
MKLCSLIFLCLLSTSPFMLGQNAELKMLAEEDQASRLGKHIARTDEDRIKLVLQLLAQGAVTTPQDRFNAGLVLQHTPLDFCGEHMLSKSADNYLLAHYLAEQSFEAGYQLARNLAAVTIDRYLALTEGRQKYGTQTLFDQQTGKAYLPPIDRSVPDSERARYGVAPLAQLLSATPEQNTVSASDSAASNLWSDWKFLLGAWTAGEGGGVPGKASAGSFSYPI